MAITRFAEATWNGDLINGSGSIDYVSSGAFARMPVTWASRTEEHNGRTSPEELMASAHAACFSMAFSASSANLAWSIPATVPTTVRSLRVIRQPASTLSNVMTHFTASLVAGVLLRASCAESAIEKQDACADATSSSGLVRPLCSSVRDAQVTGWRENAPDDT